MTQQELSQKTYKVRLATLVTLICSAATVSWQISTFKHDNDDWHNRVDEKVSSLQGKQAATEKTDSVQNWKLSQHDQKFELVQMQITYNK